MEPIPEGLYLRAVTKPLCGFIRDQRKVSNFRADDETRGPSSWNWAFFKTYSEKCSFGHFLVNSNRIWVIHVAMYYFYTAFNPPNIY